MYKICQVCEIEFKKRETYSKKYWETAKFCSQTCSRKGLPSPRKREPNPTEVTEGVAKMFIKKKGKLYSVFLDEKDYKKPEVCQFAWYLSAGGYPTRRVFVDGKYRNKSLHQFILQKTDGMVVDHIDRNPLNNVRSNLRYLTHQNNLRNSNTRNLTGVVGGSFTKSGKIALTIKVDVGVLQYLGRFKTKEEALIARNAAEIKYWGHSYH